MSQKHVILGIYLANRLQQAAPVQALLTDYGCNIKTRIGLHEVTGEFCAGYGLLLLEMIGDLDVTQEFTTKLAAIEGVEVQRMMFNYP
ncbi:hypothetical protein [Desulfuromonas sp. CSMB_57]|jgi:hypothetical protein|uniref:hypothetical protein n=1 Tax=Desulfuromonas sp. CSMB_57 TaxID=2807629 RepID=UPI001CD1FDD1|nr:hypothetical protein [Desulfuromonas sp. CSMB_57]